MSLGTLKNISQNRNIMWNHKLKFLKGAARGMFVFSRPFIFVLARALFIYVFL